MRRKHNSEGYHMNDMIITELALTCLACPSQWNGTLSDGRPLYIRYRHGYLSASFGVAGEQIFGLHVPGADIYDGFMELDEMLQYTGLHLAPGVIVAERWDE